MQTWVALIRGINVGGKNILPMATLAEDLRALEFSNVRTYIQSGNVVFQSERGRKKRTAASDFARRIVETIENRHGFKPHVLVLRIDEFNKAMDANPFPGAQSEPKTLHLLFLDSTPKSPDLESLEDARSATEKFHLDPHVLYLHAPDGIARSKFAAKVERALGVPATGRNWRTVTKIRELAGTI